MAKKDSGNMIAVLKKQIKSKELKNVYLFYGAEEYLKELYIKEIEKLVPDNGFPEFNRTFLNGERPLSEYDEAWESVPMMADKRLIIIKNSNIMRPTKKKKDEDDEDASAEERAFAAEEKASAEEKKKFWTEKFKHISDDTVVIFNETTVDKRSVIYKALGKIALTVEFNYMSDAELVSYVLKQCLNRKRKISKDTAQYLVSRVDPGLENLNNELEKLFDFCGDEIYKSDVDRVIPKSLNVITFDLTDAIMTGDADRAAEVLNDIKTLTKTSSFAILYLMLSNFEKLLHVKLLGNRPQYDIAAAISVTPYIANKYISAARRFSAENLKRMVTRVAEIDLEIKEGKTDDWTALYTYVMECLHMMG